MKTTATKKKPAKLKLSTLNSSPLRSISGVTMKPIRILNGISTKKR